MSELKPCPFCGGKATADSQFGRQWWVECDDCQVSTGGAEPTRAAAIAVWNRRSTSSQPPLTINDFSPESVAVPIEPPLTLLPHLTSVGSLEGLSERDRGVYLARLRTRWTEILAAAAAASSPAPEQQGSGQHHA